MDLSTRQHVPRSNDGAMLRVDDRVRLVGTDRIGHVACVGIGSASERPDGVLVDMFDGGKASAPAHAWELA